MKKTRQHKMDRETFEYMDGLILTSDEDKLNQTIDSLYNTLVNPDEVWEYNDFEDFIYEKIKEKLGHLKNK